MDWPASTQQHVAEEVRELVFLKYYGGKRTIVIAQALGMDLLTVAMRLRRTPMTMRSPAKEEG